MELSKVYKAVLSMAAIEADEEDKIFTSIKGQKHYIKHGGKDIYLPTKKAASVAPLNNGLIFNPLNENVLVKKDVVFTKVMDKIFADLNSIVSTWVFALAKLMEQNGEAGTSMSPAMLGVIKDVGEVPKDFSARMMLFAAACADSNQNCRYLSYKISSSVKAGDKSFNKKCVVWSPYKKTMDSLYSGEWSKKDDESKRVAGAVLRKSDGKPFEKMLLAILPGLQSDTYSTDSLSQICPTADTFLKSLKEIIKDLSSFHSKVKSCEDFEWPDYDLSWIKFMTDVDKHVHVIRNMPNDCANIMIKETPAQPSIDMAAAQEKANARLIKDSTSIPPWEEDKSAAVFDAVVAKPKIGNAPTLEDLLNGKAPKVAGPVTQAMRDNVQTQQTSGAPSVASILGNMQQTGFSNRVVPVQPFTSGSLVQNRFAPTMTASVPSMVNMRYPGQGF